MKKGQHLSKATTRAMHLNTRKNMRESYKSMKNQI